MFAERAAFCVASSTLFIADPHFGKDVTLRRAGVPLPGTASDDDIARLDELMARTGAGTIVVLGDLLHARSGRSPALFSKLLAFRRRWPELDMVLIRGNHDCSAGDPPPELQIRCVDEPHRHDGIDCYHHGDSRSVRTEALSVCGHVHPVVSFPRALGRKRFPVFLLRDNLLLLPAFGSCTGGHRTRLMPGDVAFLIDGSAVIRMSRPPAK